MSSRIDWAEKNIRIFMAPDMNTGIVHFAFRCENECMLPLKAEEVIPHIRDVHGIENSNPDWWKETPKPFHQPYIPTAQEVLHKMIRTGAIRRWVQNSD
jgi:hypothetical protein